MTSTGGTGTFCDARDNTTYKCVVIGTQTWMAQNLNYGSKVAASVEQSAGDKYCYNDLDSRCASFGGLYQWSAAMALASSYNSTKSSSTGTVQGACPSGWHVPSQTEWETLKSAATCSYNGSTITTSNTTLTTTTNGYTKTLNTGYCLKCDGTSIAGYDDIIGGGSGSDAYGWMGLPGGGRYPTGYTGDNVTGTLTAPGYVWGAVDSMTNSSGNPKGFRGMWWATTESAADIAYYADLSDDTWNMNISTGGLGGASSATTNKNQGLSLRCVQN